MSVDEYIRLMKVVKFLRNAGYEDAANYLVSNQNDVWRVQDW